MGTLCAQLLLQIYADSFEASQVSRHACGLEIILRLFFVTFFPQFELGLFSGVITVHIDSMYLARTTPINFTFSDNSLFL